MIAPGCGRREGKQQLMRPFSPISGDLVRAGSPRRGFLQTGLAGLAGLSLPALLRQNALAAEAGRPKSRSNVILFWLSGGPSHIDMWDPKPDAPRGNPRTVRRHPDQDSRASMFASICRSRRASWTSSRLIRSVDCSASNHTPITMQAGNSLARRTNDGRDGGGYPSMGSVAAKFRGSNAPGMPGYVALGPVPGVGYLGCRPHGTAYEPVDGQELAGRLALSRRTDGGATARIDALWPRKWTSGSEASATTQHIAAADIYTQQAYDVLLTGRAQRAFNLDEETPALRDAYGRNSIGEKALLARRSSKRAPPLSRSAAPGATSIIMATTSNGAASRKVSRRSCPWSTAPCTPSSRTWKRAGCSTAR